ncbi:MAG: acetyltransferase [Desulfuromonadaceae bacterium GWC2_58_13]|nr:MAG: acetyltransferase [Desulfuromonadaceae bacterium GWC2_58_13]
MLFNSYVYILAFLPLTALVFFTLTRFRFLLAGKAWLVGASLFFYAWWNPLYLPLIVASMLGNYTIGTMLAQSRMGKGRRLSPSLAGKILALGILLNLALLGYYKYADFFLKNVNSLAGADLPLLHLVLPLAISFFTFQQIAYLVDSYRGETEEYDFINYCLFVAFFPQLIAGPIVHHKEVMPQFARPRNALVNWRNIATGISVFSIGLFKKVIIADTFAIWASAGFDQAPVLPFFEAWATSLSYTFQLYFDFSGYTDMAIGSALLFNIRLPINFNSPYKAVNIQDFWRRWHMTLSRWLRDYLYLPLGGNRKGEGRTYLNLFLTFLLGGLWHGAGWTFVLWGAMHGAGTAIHKFWQHLGLRLPRAAAWAVTFLFVHCSWVFFRATNFEDALKVFRGMAGLSGIVLPKSLASMVPGLQEFGISFGRVYPGIDGNSTLTIAIIVFGAIVLFARNSNELAERFRPNWSWALYVAALGLVGLSGVTRVSEFLYFQF